MGNDWMPSVRMRGWELRLMHRVGSCIKRLLLWLVPGGWMYRHFVESTMVGSHDLGIVYCWVFVLTLIRTIGTQSFYEWSKETREAYAALDTFHKIHDPESREWVSCVYLSCLYNYQVYSKLTFSICHVLSWMLEWQTMHSVLQWSTLCKVW